MKLKPILSSRKPLVELSDSTSALPLPTISIPPPTSPELKKALNTLLKQTPISFKLKGRPLKKDN